MRWRNDTLFHIAIALMLLAGSAHAAAPATSAVTADTDDADASDDRSYKQRLLDGLPPVLGDGLDVDAWGWAGDLQTLSRDSHQRENYHDVELGLGITKSFGQRFTVSGQVNGIDADGSFRAELEQLYASAKVWDAGSTVLTVGKFNANLGVEGRDFWDRTTGTPSLLFAAQPQDLIGLQLRQPIGSTGLALRPFLTEDFQGGYDFNQSPTGGLAVDYKPNRFADFGVTNMAGPGYVLFGGRHVHPPFARGDYGGDPQGAVVENWQGSNLMADRAGTLYFLEARAALHPVTDLTLSAEYLFATSGTKFGRWGWTGFLAMADYQVTDELHAFGRWSYLDDSDWLVTGVFQRAQELSVGLGYQLIEGLELRGEYRHDFSSATPDFDSVSLHATFTY